MTLGKWAAKSKWRMAFASALLWGGPLSAAICGDMYRRGVLTFHHALPMVLMCVGLGMIFGLILWAGLSTTFPRE